MELDAIAVFIKVVQAGSFTRAAKLLGMPNSTVSAKVSGLERRLGLTLLTRTTRKLRLTNAGERYFEKCSRALEEIQTAEAELTTSRAEPRGTLKITAASDFGHSVLPAVVQQYLKKYPATRVELLVTNRIVDLVAEGIDLAIRAGELKDSSLKARKFPAGTMALWASPNYLKKSGAPEHPKDLKDFEVLIFKGARARPVKLTNGKETVQITDTSRVAIDDLETTKRFARLGQGIALLPGFLCADEVSNGTLQPVLPKWVTAPINFHFVFPATKFVSLEVQAFMKLALETWKSGSP
jgi:DNA-binding transcriptional LysR family regulator